MPKQMTGVVLIIASHPLGNWSMLGYVPRYAPYILILLGLIIFARAEIEDNAGTSEK